MSIDYSLLRTLHRMHRQLADIDERMRKGPLQVKIATNNEASFLAALEEKKEQAKKNRMAADAKQLQMNEREAKVEDMKSKLNACDSNKEFQLLKDRIAADEQASSVLADEIFEMLEKQDVIDQQVTEATANYEKSVNEKQQVTQRIGDELETLKSQRARVSQELAELEKKLPHDILPDYRRRADAKKEDALAETDTSTCGNCHQHLTSQTASVLLMNQAVFCQGCGALLYVKEGVRP